MFPPLFGLGGQAPAAPAPAPAPRPQPHAPAGPPAWLQMLPAMFAIGSGLGGNPTMGTAALSGARQADLDAEEMRRHQVAEGQRQQQIDMQQAAMLAAADARQQQMEERKNAALRASVDDLRQQKFPTKEAYEQSVAFHENLIGQQYGALRPHTLRMLVPYNGPDVKSKARAAVDALVKTHGVEIFASGAMVQVDRDGDGIPESIPVLEAAELGEFPIAKDPQTGQPMLPPKETKPENVQDFDLAYGGVLEEWKAEGKDINNPAVKGKAAAEARLRLGKASRQATTSIVMPSRPGALPAAQRRANQLADAFRQDPTVKRTNVQAEAVSFVQSLDPSSNNAADDQALIYAFAKAMDPDSVVREGEYAVVQKYAQSWMDNFKFNAVRVIQNREFLTPQARANMKATILKRYSAGRAQYDNIRKQYVKQINNATGEGDGEDLLLDYAAAFPAPNGQTTQKAAPQQKGSGSFSVTAPNGKTYTFATQEQLDRFKAAAGINK
jgi:hypothetical protein